MKREMGVGDIDGYCAMPRKANDLKKEKYSTPSEFNGYICSIIALNCIQLNCYQDFKYFIIELRSDITETSGGLSQRDKQGKEAIDSTPLICRPPGARPCHSVAGVISITNISQNVQSAQRNKPFFHAPQQHTTLTFPSNVEFRRVEFGFERRAIQLEVLDRQHERDFPVSSDVQGSSNQLKTLDSTSPENQYGTYSIMTVDHSSDQEHDFGLEEISLYSIPDEVLLNANDLALLEFAGKRPLALIASSVRSSAGSGVGPAYSAYVVTLVNVEREGLRKNIQQPSSTLRRHSYFSPLPTTKTSSLLGYPVYLQLHLHPYPDFCPNQPFQPPQLTHWYNPNRHVLLSPLTPKSLEAKPKKQFNRAKRLFPKKRAGSCSKQGGEKEERKIGDGPQFDAIYFGCCGWCQNSFHYK
ncbi:uncharacterized protein BDR25DRAFT_363075 [Lindgomyces ingoldianus]|uniref:Uncharacterized protein n=1 Tax=Lindgomyces ingoldianus TaxID=673940 RepID=A0ACB6Q835_9PLEO|nr:uncharacterized protein BDR25DRAFT_363075 [Lindgomyces ingoldianus]KAF2463169.1 hypothetical protein BDR25DRAFT_363075 [Lindgomyces ingoldianus]